MRKHLPIMSLKRSMRALTASLRSPGLRIRALSCCNGAAESSRRIQSRGASQSAADVYKRLLWWRSGATATNGRLIFGTVALFAGAFGAASASALVLLAARSERGLTDELERQRSAATRGVRTVTVAARVALDYKTSLWGFDDHKSPAYKDALAACHRRSAQRLLELCRTQAGVYIKAGQHLASLRPIIPAEFTETLATLCDDAPQSSLAEVAKVFREDIGRPLQDTFAAFDPVPLGCASLAQVHRAELKLQGEEQLVEVAVKVANEPGAPAAGALPAAAARAERAESDGQPPPPRACRAACRSPSGTACGRSK